VALLKALLIEVIFVQTSAATDDAELSTAEKETAALRSRSAPANDQNNA
jgi:hypothetical protein